MLLSFIWRPPAVALCRQARRYTKIYDETVEDVVRWTPLLGQKNEPAKRVCDMPMSQFGVRPLFRSGGALWSGGSRERSERLPERNKAPPELPLRGLPGRL